MGPGLGPEAGALGPDPGARARASVGPAAPGPAGAEIRASLTKHSRADRLNPSYPRSPPPNISDPVFLSQIPTPRTCAGNAPQPGEEEALGATAGGAPDCIANA